MSKMKNYLWDLAEEYANLATQAESEERDRRILEIAEIVQPPNEEFRQLVKIIRQTL